MPAPYPTGRAPVLAALLGLALTASGCRSTASVPDAERRAIADTLSRRIEQAYDFGQGGAVVDRLMALYPDTGRVVSAAAGHVTTSRDSLRAELTHFWEWVGQNMQQPRWRWGPRYVEVLSPTAAVMTATYAIDHRTPEGRSHSVGGAWTALFEKRDGRWVIVQEHLSDAPAASAMPTMGGMP